ncbi:hypothetical protein [Moraxella bovis]|nr:hypothetical protein [Moraxella bovis]UZA21646.1 hypothetical protein LP106_10475 [Moraxella bovis]
MPAIYDMVQSFENGNTLVIPNGETFYIDKTGKRLD